MLEAKNISLAYPDGDKEKVVLDNINLKLMTVILLFLWGHQAQGKVQ